MDEMEILEKLMGAVVQGEADEAENWARKAVEKGLNPMKAIEKLRAGMKQVGDAFGRGEIFLVDLALSADVMKKASAILEEEILKKGLQKKMLGKFVIGTVAGDIHDIGKSIVVALLRAAGFDVVDLGIDVPTDKFVEAVEKHQPDILGLSALLSVTKLEQGRVIEELKKAGLRGGVKVIVRGGATTGEYAEEIGADGYAEEAEYAVTISKKLLRR